MKARHVYPALLAAAFAVGGWLALRAPRAGAQVVREDDTKSVAGILEDSYDDFTFTSAGGEILFADLDADVYQMAGRAGGEEDHEDGGSGGPGGGGGGGEDEGGCEEETGPGGLCLQVLDEQGGLVCFADRPMRPGWQRDPRLICALPQGTRPATYLLRVALRGGEGSCGQTSSYPNLEEGTTVPYLLNVSMRGVAPEGSLSRATGISTNHL